MASYASYKKLVNENFVDGAITDTNIADDALASWNVLWVRGEPCVCSSGCCCAWTVPTKVTRVFIEAWGGGGGGHGACACNRCQHHKGAGGGYYNSRSLVVTPGSVYTICAAGTVTCCSLECIAQNGCVSYVTGTGLTNFCAIGGSPGCANGDWSTACNSEFSCCLGPISNGGEFGMGNHPGVFRSNGLGICWCWNQGGESTGAPFIGADVRYYLNCCWMRCGCWTVPYGAGGLGAQHGLCGSGCCGTGGHGGPGLVKITYY
jgi:hypothetical protein